MFDISTVQLDWQGLNLKLETGLMARQADGAVLATLGSTSVLCTVCAAKSLILQMTFSRFLFTTLKKPIQQERFLEVFLKEREDLLK